jgi:tetrapyrrole methylase family protein/MazG family protein
MARGRVTVVGLGPSGRDGLTVQAVHAWECHGTRFVRTERHPACHELRAGGEEFRSFDFVYEMAPDLDAAYDTIVRAVLDAAATGDVLYAVPGSPHVGEETVRRLVSEAARSSIEVEVIDGVSFVEAALGAVGVDALEAGLVLVDGRDPLVPVHPVAPLLVSQIDSHLVLGDVKLALLDVYPPEHAIAVVTEAGGPGCEVRWVELGGIDHWGVDPGHLACLWVPVPAGREGRPFETMQRHRLAGRAFADLVALEDVLRSEGGCPWDAEQTHRSLAKHLVEECYEVLEAIESLPDDAPAGVTPVRPELYDHLCEELGDHLFQAVFHARLAEEAGAFDAEQMVDGIVDKLVARHPHVFGDEVAETGREVLSRWEASKAVEKGRTSAFEGIPKALPALMRAAKVQARAHAAGVDFEREVAERDLAELVAVVQRGDVPDAATAGRALFAIVVVLREAGIEPEACLRSHLDAYLYSQGLHANAPPPDEVR